MASILLVGILSAVPASFLCGMIAYTFVCASQPVIISAPLVLTTSVGSLWAGYAIARTGNGKGSEGMVNAAVGVGVSVAGIILAVSSFVA